MEDDVRRISARDNRDSDSGDTEFAEFGNIDDEDVDAENMDDGRDRLKSLDLSDKGGAGQMDRIEDAEIAIQYDEADVQSAGNNNRDCAAAKARSANPRIHGSRKRKRRKRSTPAAGRGSRSEEKRRSWRPRKRKADCLCRRLHHRHPPSAPASW